MTVDADPGERAQRQAEREALRKVRSALDAIGDDERRQRRLAVRIAIGCVIAVAAVVAAMLLFFADARERRAADESPLPLKLERPTR